jgi:putative ABC transport system ATP-binding protein
VVVFLRKPVIELKDVKKNYLLGEVVVPALRGVSLTIFEKEFVAIMGPSGSGKSTLMNLVGCLDLPTSGKVLLSGKDVTHFSESDLAQERGQKIGFVFQKFNLITSLSALENVELPLVFRGWGEDKRRRKSIEVLELVGLRERANHLPTQLSGGEQQRVAIARALAVEPDIVLADEPTGNLDSKTGQDILGLLESLHSQGKTIVVVTHDASVGKLAQRIIRIKDGAVALN